METEPSLCEHHWFEHYHFGENLKNPVSYLINRDSTKQLTLGLEGFLLYATSQEHHHSLTN